MGLQLYANSTTEDVDAVSSLTEEVNLEAATLHPHCGLACWGGRRLPASNMSDEELKAAGCKWACWGGRRLQHDANSTSQDMIAGNSITEEVDLEAATLHPHCGLACWGGRRLQLDANSTGQDMDTGRSITEDVDLETATLWPHCGLACWGGRRLETSNISDEELKAGRCRWACWGGRRLQPDANSTGQDIDIGSPITEEVDLETATLWPHCGFA